MKRLLTSTSESRSSRVNISELDSRLRDMKESSESSREDAEGVKKSSSSVIQMLTFVEVTGEHSIELLLAGESVTCLERRITGVRCADDHSKAMSCGKGKLVFGRADRSVGTARLVRDGTGIRDAIKVVCCELSGVIWIE